MAVETWRRPITVAEYYRMAEDGILHPEERVELIEGELISMPPIGPDHNDSTTVFTHLFVKRFDGRAAVRVQMTLVLSDISAPEPDVVLLRGDHKAYKGRHPDPSEVLLIVEVGNTSRSYDRNMKIPLYARNAIPEVWLVDLKDRVINVFRDPRDGEYRTTLTARPGENVACAAFPEECFPVDEIVG